MATTASADAAVMTVPRGVRIGYGVGSFCTGTFSTVPGLLLLFYMTNVLAVTPWLAGLIAFLPKVWDIVVNPIVGQRSDRGVATRGRRPWLLAGALTLPVTFAFTFAGPPLTGLPAALYVGLWWLLAATAYALFEVPYKAMPPEMTDNYHERSALLSWRMACLGLAILLSGAVAPLVAQPGGDPSLGGYRLMGVLVAVVLFAAMFGTYIGTRRAPMVSKVEAEPSLRVQLAVARGNRPFMVLLGVTCAQLLAAGIMLAGAPYFATYTLEDPEAVTALFVCLVGPIVVTMPLWIRISRRLDKRGAMVLSSALFMGGGAALSLTELIGPVWAYAWVAVIGVGYAGMTLLQFSMMADVIVADALVTSKRRAGVFTGVWTAAETVVFAGGALLFGLLLSLAGFVSSDPAHPVEQSQSAIRAVLYGATLMPAAIIAVGIWLTFKYELSAGRMAALQREHGAPAEA